MKLSECRKLALYALITAVILSLTPLSIAASASVSPMRLTESDISAAPYIKIYKADGYYPMNHYVNTDCMHPIIKVENNSASIRVSVGITGSVYYPAGLGTLMNAGGYLTKVAYSASWQGNHEEVVYLDDVANHRGGYQFNITGIPYGEHSISVYASGDILLFEDGFASTYPVPQGGSQSVNFTVTSASSESTPSAAAIFQPATSLLPIQTDYLYAMVLTALIAAAIAIFVVAKKSKSKVAN